ncbi:MAG: hypothetical protein ABR548_15900 [Actinomycetota bacterium]|nr:hypothetical protein [Actinomycetota bacterium]
MQAVDIAVSGDPSSAKSAAQQALEARKFRVKWDDEWTGTAERGNKIANAVAGALAQYFKVGVKVMQGEAGQAIVRLERQSKGYMGGAIGAMRTKKNMEKLRDDLAGAFTTQGILAWVKETK